MERSRVGGGDVSEIGRIFRTRGEVCSRATIVVGGGVVVVEGTGVIERVDCETDVCCEGGGADVPVDQLRVSVAEGRCPSHGIGGEDCGAVVRVEWC